MTLTYRTFIISATVLALLCIGSCVAGYVYCARQQKHVVNKFVIEHHYGFNSVADSLWNEMEQRGGIIILPRHISMDSSMGDRRANR